MTKLEIINYFNDVMESLNNLKSDLNVINEEVKKLYPDSGKVKWEGDYNSGEYYLVENPSIRTKQFDLFFEPDKNLDGTAFNDFTKGSNVTGVTDEDIVLMQTSSELMNVLNELGENGDYLNNILETIDSDITYHTFKEYYNLENKPQKPRRVYN